MSTLTKHCLGGEGDGVAFTLASDPGAFVAGRGAAGGGGAWGPGAPRPPPPPPPLRLHPIRPTPDSARAPNFHAPDVRVRLPVLTIHGNHDDPSGADRLSAVDLLSAARLVNYFGKLASSGQGCQMSAGHAGAGKGGVASGVRARAAWRAARAK